MKVKTSTKVLIIDDEESLREGVERILSRINYEVLKASRGEDGIDILKKEHVPIVLLDMKMPGIDGLEVLKRIGRMDKGILVIVITGFATVETAIEAMKQGAYDFIPKPFEPDQLRIVVNRAREKLQLKLDAIKFEEERKRTLAHLHTEKSRMLTIVESLPNGVIVTDTKGKVVLANPASYQHLDIDFRLEPGCHISKYVPDENLCELILDIADSKSCNDDVFSYELALKNEKYVLAKGRPVLGEKQECLGAVLTLMDISAMKVLDHIKSEFVAKVSHELKSPLSTIHEQLALVLRDKIEDTTENNQHILYRAKEKTQALISTIGDLLDLSRIEAGIVFREPEDININNLLQSVVSFLDTNATSKGQRLILEKNSQQLSVVADPIAIESVLGNLITNAINYTQKGGEIRVSSEMIEEKVKIVVKDNGFGIKEEYYKQIFERFFRIKNEETRFINGTGLGLSIVKGVVDSFGGDIYVESEPGKGSAFSVLIPCQRQI